MNKWPVRVVGIEKDGSSIFFSPTAAKAEGYIVHPLVEIGPGDIISALSKDLGINIDYVYIANIKLESNENQTYCPLVKTINLVTMHKSHFLNEISSGIYLEAIYICEDVLLFMLGDDESWIVFDNGRYPQRSPMLEHLVAISKDNIQVLHKGDQFQKFFCS